MEKKIYKKIKSTVSFFDVNTCLECDESLIHFSLIWIDKCVMIFFAFGIIVIFFYLFMVGSFHDDADTQRQFIIIDKFERDLMRGLLLSNSRLVVTQ